MDNLQYYERFRAVPETAKKKIGGGRLKGMTDINPLWRIKMLTEAFGPCGVGWKAPIRKQWIEPGANGEMMAFCNIELFIKVDGVWSDGIDGTGGAMQVSKERDGLYTDDECFKKAYTDAISVACKMLGVGADVYWDKDRTKYDTLPSVEPAQPKVLSNAAPMHSMDALRASIDEKVDTLAKLWNKTAGQIKVDACNILKVTGSNGGELAMIDRWLDEQLQKAGVA